MGWDGMGREREGRKEEGREREGKEKGTFDSKGAMVILKKEKEREKEERNPILVLFSVVLFL